MSQTNDFNRVLGEVRGGLVARDLAQKLEDAVTAAQVSGKKATITVTMTLDPHGKDNREMHVSVKSAVKLPAEPGLDERSIFYAQRGQLLRNDPDQPDLYAGPRGVANGGSPAEQPRRTGTED